MFLTLNEYEPNYFNLLVCFAGCAYIILFISKDMSAEKYCSECNIQFNTLYRIRSKNFRNDYAFAIALQQLNGFINYDTIPMKLATLPPDCKVTEFKDTGLVWQNQTSFGFTRDQDVHVLNKEIENV